MATPTPEMRIGPYELQSRIGAGGMGEVWKARDTRVDRVVAIKFSQASFNDRFEREARAIAALNHPNICTLHDVGPDYLVMEFVEGEPLQGPVSMDLALRYAAQILAALHHAHRKGIVHRDLKPANILVTRERIKLLDFGLAKFHDRGAVAVKDETVTTALTGEGTILGTLHYMAPEQLEGRDVDERSDIFAVGCVLYELITGKRPFEGRSAASLIAAVLEKKPEPLKPDGLSRVIEICLAKDPDERWQNARDLQRALELHAHEAAGAVTAPSPRTGSRLSWFTAALMALVAAAFAGAWLFRPSSEGVPARFTIEPPPGVVFNFRITATAVSPDGRFLVFRAGGGGSNPALWLRPLDSLEARLLPGTEGADFPFWSPDATSVGFFAQDKLKRIDLASGAPQVLCDIVFGAAAAGGAWNRGGVIVFADRRGLFRISESGGAPVSLLTAQPPLEGGFGYPQFLPDGKRLLFFVGSGNPETEGVYATSLDRPQNRVVVLKTSSKAIYVPAASGLPARLLCVRGRNLLAYRFDSVKLRTEGDPVALAKDVSVLPALRAAAFWLSESGLLVYRSGLAMERLKLVWRDRDGRRLGEAGPEGPYASLRLSPDGKRLAVGRREADSPGLLWIIDFARAVSARLTAHMQFEALPSWSPDGRYVAFASMRNGVYHLFLIEPNGVNAEVQYSNASADTYPTDWSRDGKYLLYDQGPSGASDIWAKPNPVASTGGPDIPVLRTPFDEADGQFSPDGNWIAYSSNASGRYEIYVMSFSADANVPVGRWQISNRGGRAPRWRGDGKELYYLTDENRLMAVTIRTAARSLQAETPHELFPTSTPSDAGDTHFPYDVTADGRRFLLEERAATDTGAPLTAVVNWQAGLKQ